ncbi:putative pectinesterase inhibitor domain, Cell wall/vacuolar inhibitor of fructosidase [Arabidopsis thaliana]|uniref:Pectinesterase inhibitor domain n=1 Tax=Arabidopsis thaliana x Arabidopsis arenosa TaxID=1240361 RepID=A0A8T2EVG1_9BRAS|nr:Pectinesterase inhibitor domain [Arabidopsis thaliana x Arabidopsis arenosa]
MNIFIYIFAIFVVLSQIQIALSQTIQSPPGSSLVQRLCKRNRYQALCISTLNVDPRSKTSNLQGLASISLDATTKKFNVTLTYYISVLKNVRGRVDFERYGTCIEEYGAAVDRFLPAVKADLKAKKYPEAMSEMKDVVAKPGYCEDQFAGESPVTARNKAVHDIADMTADIIKTL